MFPCIVLILIFGCRETPQAPVKGGVDFPEEPHYKVGFLIMDGVYNTELTAPYDIFQHTRFREGIKPMVPFLIANTLEKDPSKMSLTEDLWFLPSLPNSSYAYQCR